MRYPIDVVMTDEDGRVIAVYPGLEPWTRTRVHRDAARVFEFPEGTIEAADTRLGDRLEAVSGPDGDDARGAKEGR